MNDYHVISNTLREGLSQEEKIMILKKVQNMIINKFKKKITDPKDPAQQSHDSILSSTDKSKS